MSGLRKVLTDHGYQTEDGDWYARSPGDYILRDVARLADAARAGEGLREALLRIYDLSMEEGMTARLDIREVASAALRAASPTSEEKG